MVDESFLQPYLGIIEEAIPEQAKSDYQTTREIAADLDDIATLAREWLAGRVLQNTNKIGQAQPQHSATVNKTARPTRECPF